MSNRGKEPGLSELPKIDPEDQLICLGHEEDLEAQAGSMAPPIVRTSLFAQQSSEQLAAGLAAEHEHHVYSRGQNPTVEALEDKLARLERGDACKCVASGMAAVSAVLFGLLEAGAHVLFVNNTYGPTLGLAQRLKAFGVEHDVCLGLGVEQVAAGIRDNTRIVWLESPGTMLFRIADIEAIAGLAKKKGALSVLDNSWATPLFQKPLTLGVDLVVHSVTKYLGGHSDLVAGAMIGGPQVIEEIFYKSYLLLGGALSPGDAWLVNRGLRTLPARMRQHHTDGLAVARFLDAHPKVRQVFHPAIQGEPGLVEKQMRGFSGLFGIELASDSYDDVAAFIDRLERFRIGVSWGGVESLALSPNRGTNTASLAAQDIPPGTVRLSVGLEGSEVLIEDLARALDSL